MSDHSRFCRPCRRQTLHRSRWSAFAWALVISFVLGALRIRGLAEIGARATIGLAIAPPAPIRCQTCGTANGREINFTASNGSTTGTGGAIYLNAGDAVAAAGTTAGGGIELNTGNAAAASGGANGGDITPLFGTGAGTGRTGRMEFGDYVLRRPTLLDYAETTFVIGNATGATTIVRKTACRVSEFATRLFQ